MRKFIMILLSSQLLAATTSEIDVRSLNVAIKASDLQWIAGETKFTKMAKTERAQYLLTEKPKAPAAKMAITVGSVFGEEPSPNAFDWMAYQTPIKDQGPCGSCWAFATLAAVESSYRISAEDPALAMDLSEQFALSCLTGGCDGGLLEPVMMQLTQEGIPDEACMPYTGRDLTPCSARCSDWRARAVTVEDWSWVVPELDDDGESIRAALMRGPVVTAMVVYTDLWAYTSGIYEHVSGESEGFHALLLVGWEEDVWIAKNSWGTDWGEEGYLRIRQEQCGIASYGVQVHVKPGDVPDLDRPPILGCGCGMVY